MQIFFCRLLDQPMCTVYAVEVNDYLRYRIIETYSNGQLASFAYRICRFVAHTLEKMY